jgi:hypothetical protein
MTAHADGIWLLHVGREPSKSRAVSDFESLLYNPLRTFKKLNDLRRVLEFLLIRKQFSVRLRYSDRDRLTASGPESWRLFTTQSMSLVLRGLKVSSRMLELGSG